MCSICSACSLWLPHPVSVTNSSLLDIEQSTLASAQSVHMSAYRRSTCLDRQLLPAAMLHAYILFAIYSLSAIISLKHHPVTLATNKYYINIESSLISNTIQDIARQVNWSNCYLHYLHFKASWCRRNDSCWYSSCVWTWCLYSLGFNYANGCCKTASASACWHIIQEYWYFLTYQYLPYHNFMTEIYTCIYTHRPLY